MTPWYENAIPFAEAAEMGTKKVISEHSTIGLVITTDGSITDIDREDYLDAEARVIHELQEIKKPFIVILNTVNPYSERALAVKAEIEEKYNVSVMPVNCKEMNVNDVNAIMEKVLFEFPLKEIGINIPKWVDTLESDHWLKRGLRDVVAESVRGVFKIRDTYGVSAALEGYEYVSHVNVAGINLGEGTVIINVMTPESLFFKLLMETSGFDVNSREDLMTLMRDLAKVKKEYDKVAMALREVNQKGYGIVSPTIDELTLEEPEIVKQGNRFGVRLKASAPSIQIVYYKGKFRSFSEKRIPCQRIATRSGIHSRAISPVKLKIA